MSEELIKEIGDHLEKLQRQRAFLMAAMAHLMERDFEDPEAIRLKIVLATAFIDKIFEKGHVLNDDAERVVLVAMKEMLLKEKAIEEIKKDLRSSDPF